METLRQERENAVISPGLTRALEEESLYIFFFFLILCFCVFWELLNIDCSLQCSRHWNGEGSSSRSFHHGHKQTWSVKGGRFCGEGGFLEEVALEKGLGERRADFGRRV